MKIRIIKKNADYSLEYEVGDVFEVEGTWYGGVHISGRTGVPVSLDKDEYVEIEEAKEVEDKSQEENLVSGMICAKDAQSTEPEGDREPVLKYEKIRKQVLEAIFDAVEQGLIKGTSGNIALRDDVDDVVAITPSGIPYKGMKPEDIAIVDMDGNWIDGPYKPSSELPMHLSVLRARTDMKATVHTHAMYATIMAMGEDAELKAITPPQCEFVPVKIVPFVMPGSPELAEKIVEAIGEDGRAVLLKNHGMFCCGKSMFAAMEATAYTEEMAVATLYSKLLGTYEPMTEDAVLKVKALIASSQAV